MACDENQSYCELIVELKEQVLMGGRGNAGAAVGERYD